MALLSFLRIGFAVRFWRRVRLAAFVYVGGIVVLALLQLIFHVRL
jgi:hypothetical protein